MSDKPADMGPGEYEGLRRKLVADALSKFSFTKPDKQTDLSVLVLRAREVDLSVKRTIRPVLEAGGWQDKSALRETAATLYVEAFNSFTKEELQNIVSLLYLEMFLEFVDASPWGDSKPDLLGGI